MKLALPRPGSDRRAWWLAVAAITLVGLLARVWLLWRANWMLDGDEATMGLLGRHILVDHERPIFFPGQAYMGAWQAYLAAGLFEIFGMSRVVAKLPPLLASGAFVVTLTLLARRVYGPGAALLAGAFAALPSLYLISTTLRLSYPLIDVMAIGNVVLLLAVDSADRARPPRDFTRRALLLGLLTGFAFWLHAAIAVYAAPAGLLLLLRYPRRALWPGAPAASLGFVVGAAPVFQFARSHAYTTFDYLRGSGSDTAQRDYGAIGEHLTRTILPRVFGLAVPWQATSPLIQLAVGLPTLVALALLAWRCRGAPLAWARLRPQHAPSEAVVALFGLTVLATYVLSRFSVYAITFPNADATGRYVAPLGTFIPLALAGAARQLNRAGDLARVAAAAGVVLILGGTALAYAASDGNAVFQSPYYRQLPASDAALIRTLDDLGVDAVWMDHWAGKPLMFDTRERIAAADYVDLRVWGGIDRLAADTNRVFAADRPAFVFVTTTDTTPLEQELRRRGVAYDARSAGGYRVVVPRARLDPATVTDALIAGR